MIFCLLLVAVSPAIADLRDSVRKYDSVVVNIQYLERIKQFEHLIVYFSGFSYFEAHHVVSPDFIKALIIAESSCNPLATSAKDARGLGQLQYSTAKIIADSLYETGVNFKYIDEKHLKNLQPDDLYQPAMNILLTCALISKYNFWYDGRIELVLTAWNAGENVAPLKKRSPVTYPETENLIGKVNGYYLYFLNNK